MCQFTVNLITDSLKQRFSTLEQKTHLETMQHLKKSFVKLPQSFSQFIQKQIAVILVFTGILLGHLISVFLNMTVFMYRYKKKDEKDSEQRAKWQL